jgi:hypothetical protein
MKDEVGVQHSASMIRECQNLFTECYTLTAIGKYQKLVYRMLHPDPDRRMVSGRVKDEG